MKRILSSLLCAALLLSLCACGGYESYTLTPNEYLLGEGQNLNTTPQLSVEDIQEMNKGNARFVYGDNGYISFMQGKFYQQRIEDYEQAIPALYGVASLIGMAAGSEFFCVSGYRDKNGYTCYTYQQRYGDETVMYATLKVLVDPQGYTAGLVSSFEPNLGIVDSGEGISAQQAEEVVRAVFADYNLSYYSQQTHKVLVTLNNVCYRAWVVYTSNPESTAEEWGMSYYEHLVAMDGTFLSCLPVASFESTNTDAFQPDKYFQDLEPMELTIEAELYHGGREMLTLPISRNPKTGDYYLMDPIRKIAAADFYRVMYAGDMAFIQSSDPYSWNSADLLAYDRYIKAYDFFAELGYYSVDGTGIPLLVCTDYCDSQGRAVDNAGFCGINYGWAVFGASHVNALSEAVDVVAHEFTHGITNCAAVGNYYANESGAINEAFSDILGNICEMMGSYTSDKEWLMGENGGEAFRSLSQPEQYQQPLRIGGRYYQSPASDPYNAPDLGGVHTNSSLLGQMAWVLDQSGMSMQEQRSLWLTANQLITPLVGYKEIHAALMLSIDINGLDARYKEVLTNAFSAANLL